MTQGVKASDKPWLQFYDEGVPPSIEYPEIALDTLLKQSATKYPEHPAIIFCGAVESRVLDKPMSYQEFDVAIDKFAAAMQKLGVKKGDRVAIFMPNCPQFVIAHYGTLRAGGISVPCNFLYTTNEIKKTITRFWR